MASLTITLLGGFEARLASGETLALKGQKAQALLAYLALSPDQTCTRDELVALLWSDRGQEQARASLRQSLAQLRKALDGAAPLFAGRDRVALDDVKVDVAAFEQLVEQGTPATLEEAIALYRGDLLHGTGVRDPAFEGWLRDQRRRLNERACDALQALLRHQDDGAALATVQRLLALDPLRESAHRALMEIYARSGERALALQHYQTCRDLLAAELSVAPEPETERLAREIRDGTPAPELAIVAAEPLPLPKEPSIAVLPFADLSGDAEQAHFADCIAEDIITALSKIPKLFVVARTSSFAYKDRAVDVKQVGREQGVHYVLEGSVQRSAARVRISAQLIDATDGRHIWAERYDRVVDDVFALQDEITREVALALQIKLTEGERARIAARGTDNLEAWELQLQANDLMQGHRREDLVEGRRLAEQALRLDPNYGSAIALLGWAHWMDAFNGWSAAPDESLTQALETAERSLAIDPENAETWMLKAMVHLSREEHDEALAQSESAQRLGTRNSKVLAIKAIVLMYCDRMKEAEALLGQAMRYCPIYPAWYPGTVSEVHFAQGRLDECVAMARASLARDPDYIYAHIPLACALAEAGRLSEARAAGQEVLRIEPSFQVAPYVKGQPYRSAAVRHRIAEALRAAGLPG
ncbi:MAG: BTAD domain-containing putative transcriptional regulator [Pseudomonadota bacterium]